MGFGPLSAISKDDGLLLKRTLIELTRRNLSILWKVVDLERKGFILKKR